MSNLRFCVFPLQSGFGAIAWSEETNSVTHTLLPVRLKQDAVSNMHSHGASEAEKVPKWVRDLTKRMQAYFKGTKDDFQDVPVEFLARTNFQREIYRVLRKVRAGRTVSYGELAAKAGSPAAARAVGQAMAKNPVPLIIPCHRVLSSNGRMQGFSAERGVELKQEMLALESD